MPDHRFSVSPDLQNNDDGPAIDPRDKMPAVDTNHRHFDAGGNATPIVPAPAPQPAAPRMSAEPPPNYKLWSKLHSDELYTKSYEDFKSQFNNPKTIDALYSKLNSDQLYTKDKGTFYSQFFDHLPTQETRNAQDFIKNYIGAGSDESGSHVSLKAAKAIDKITGDQYNQQYSQVLQGQGAAKTDNAPVGRVAPLRLTDRMHADRVDYLQKAANNPEMTRDFLSVAKRQNADDAPLIDEAMYRSDASERPHDPKTVEANAQGIKNGDLQYDLKRKQIINPVTNVFHAAWNGAKAHSAAMDKYDFYTTASDKDIINDLEAQRKAYQPDKPVDKAEGFFGTLGEMAGSGAVPALKMGAAATVMGGPEAGLAGAAASTLGVGAGALDFHNTSYANTLPEAYRHYMDTHENADPAAALDYAKGEANFSGAMAGLQGVILGKSGEAAGANFAPVRLSTGAKKAFGDIAGNLMEVGKHTAPEMVSQGTVGGIMQAIENAHQGKDVGDGVTDAALSNMTFVAALAGLKNGKGVFFTKAAKSNLMDAFAGAHPDLVKSKLETAVRMQIMTPEKANQLFNEIESHRPAIKGKPDAMSALTPEAEDFLKSVDDGNKPYLDTPNKDLLAIAKSNGIEPGENEELTTQKIINRLKKRRESANLPDTFTEKPHVKVTVGEPAAGFTNIKLKENATGTEETGGQGTGTGEDKVNSEGVRYNGRDAIGDRARPESEKIAARQLAKQKIANPETNASLKNAAAYNDQHGLPDVTTHTYKPSDPVQQGKIAELFPKLKDVNSPDYKEGNTERKIYSEYKEKYPEIFKQYGIEDYKDLVHKAYQQLTHEVDEQYKHLPVKVSFHEGDKNYENSADMLDDVHNYNHLHVFRGGDDHTELGSQTKDENGLTANDKFRAVHDYYGHSVEGYQFGKDGEENAWIEHSKMFSPLAQWALSSETRGQNSVVNYSGINEVPLAKIKAGSTLKREGTKAGNTEMVERGQKMIDEGNKEFNYAEQKAVILPQQFTDISKFHEGAPKEVPKQLFHGEQSEPKVGVREKEKAPEVQKLEAERDEKIKELKPDFSPKEIPADKLAKSDSPYVARRIHAKLMEHYKELQKIADCLWS